MFKELIITRLSELGQQHLGLQIDRLDPQALERFWRQIERWDLAALQKQRAALLQDLPRPPISPLDNLAAPTKEEIAAGQKAVEEGNVGCLILAGGQASRLGSMLPKALVPVLPVSGKCLLEIFCEKRPRASLPLSVMTSPMNHEAITDFIREKNIVNVDIFSQETLPFLDDRGNFLLQEIGMVAEGPDGNGHALKRFVDAGLCRTWQDKGIEYLVVIPIDNALADPYDAALIGGHLLKKADATLKCVARLDRNEKVGVVGRQEGKIVVREYSELPNNEHEFTAAHIGIYCFSLAFVEKAASLELPLHMARKSTKALLGTTAVWKCERFLFDVLPYAEQGHTMIFPREQTYAPLKNATGDKSLQTVQQALGALGQY